MNERILELYKQALEFSYNNVPQEDWNTGVFHPIVSGKFAEFIVRECILISRTSTDGFGAGKRMEEHFGVEE